MVEKPRILVVEDSVPVATALRQSLEQELDAEVVLASTYEQGAANITEHKGSFFLAILDLSLPDADQGKIVDLALEHMLPCIVYTSQIDAELRQRLLDRNIIDYVIKNSQGIDTLVYSVKRLLQNREVRILVVDDSLPMRRMMRAMLKMYMLNIHVASSADAALSILNKHRDISVVVTDYEMPGMDGVQLCTRIRETWGREELSIIGVSAMDLELLPVMFIKSGADDFIKKPFSREEFYLRVINNQEKIEGLRKQRELNDLKNRFLGIAAHDLRNPINGITGFSNILQEELEQMGAHEQADIARLINTASSQMLQLVRDLLDISVIESGKLDLRPELLDLPQLIRERIRIMDISAALKQVDIELHLPDSLEIFCDSRRITQVVDNLLSNAVKFSPQGGVVRVAATTSGDNVEVRVSDQGPGISPDEQHRLFESFSKINSSPSNGEPGTGLGLSIVRRIVDAHHGHTWVESSLGNGASFFFSLPAKGTEMGSSRE